ncbi:hypothetical protein H2204_012273 [Knufia peltigerae]|uniref:Uncharacterized protein n=1 Tax=Knufia peltigerae TaxID=1002370 RepID=A0AA38XT28_9EURO|nr:hypothetical protein H2204_012273 [Knufia peltigerae]
MEHINNIKYFPEYSVPLRTTYTGLGPLDGFLQFLVTAFAPGAAGWDPAFHILQPYFLVSFFPLVSIFVIESGRKRNHHALTSYTGVWALFYQIVGGAVIIPLWFLAYLWDSRSSDYFSPESRKVTLAYAKSLLPALGIGYLIPTILMFLPYSQEDYWTTQFMIALWQPSPWFVNAIRWVLSKFYAKEQPGGVEDENGSEDHPADLDYLGTIYRMTFVVSAVTHIATMAICFFSTRPEYSFRQVFIPGEITTDTSLSEALRMIFQVDFWIIFSAALVWALFAVWELKRVGLTDVGLLNNAVTMVVQAIIFGPAATTARFWSWREYMMIKKPTGANQEKHD